MTALTFPLTFPEDLRISTVSFNLVPTVEVTPLRSGAIMAADLGPSLWNADYRSAPLQMDKLGVARAFLDTLSSTQPFYGYDYPRRWPYAYRRSHWTGLGGFNGTGQMTVVQSNLVEVTITTLPIGFVLTPGDYFHFDYGTRRALHRIVVGGTANGSGVVNLEVRPEIRAGWDSGSPASKTVTFYQPSARMLVVPGSYQESIDMPPAIGRISFRAVQTL